MQLSIIARIVCLIIVPNIRTYFTGVIIAACSLQGLALGIYAIQIDICVVIINRKINMGAMIINAHFTIVMKISYILV